MFLTFSGWFVFETEPTDAWSEKGVRVCGFRSRLVAVETAEEDLERVRRGGPEEDSSLF